ncbi:thrombospondin type 3 repeat-containing protein [bacterium]|nr:thrombospondin type 3 repeat-containing protein [bacterium]
MDNMIKRGVLLCSLLSTTSANAIFDEGNLVLISCDENTTDTYVLDLMIDTQSLIDTNQIINIDTAASNTTFFSWHSSHPFERSFVIGTMNDTSLINPVAGPPGPGLPINNAGVLTSNEGFFNRNLGTSFRKTSNEALSLARLSFNSWLEQIKNFANAQNGYSFQRESVDQCIQIDWHDTSVNLGSSYLGVGMQWLTYYSLVEGTDDFSYGGGGTYLNLQSTVDSDGDGVLDLNDNCITTHNSNQLNIDGDSVGNACDDDLDGDFVDNILDAFPNDPNEQNDTDSDGIGDNSDNCTATFNTDQINDDGDAFGNACDSDYDNDGISNSDDAFPNDPTETNDTDSDGVGDNMDNCPNIANQNQDNLDSDSFGDLCDKDKDGDGWINLYEERFGFNSNSANDAPESTEDLQEKILMLDQELSYIINEKLIIQNNKEIDTDSDGISDALEVVLGSDPNDANDSGLLNQIKDYVVNSIGKSVPAMSSIGLLALGLSMLGLGAVRLRKK